VATSSMAKSLTARCPKPRAPPNAAWTVPQNHAGVDAKTWKNHCTCEKTLQKNETLEYIYTYIYIYTYYFVKKINNAF
jgi:hypothetical protein